MQIGDRVVVQIRPWLGRVGTLIELVGQQVVVRLDAGAVIIRCRLADLIPLH